MFDSFEHTFCAAERVTIFTSVSLSSRKLSELRKLTKSEVRAAPATEVGRTCIVTGAGNDSLVDQTACLADNLVNICIFLLTSSRNSSEAFPTTAF